MRSGEGRRDQDGGLTAIEASRVIDVRPARRRVPGVISTIVVTLRAWAMAVKGYQPCGGRADRPRTRASEDRFQRDLDRLRWPDGMRVNGPADDRPYRP